MENLLQINRKWFLKLLRSLVSITQTSEQVRHLPAEGAQLRLGQPLHLPWQAGAGGTFLSCHTPPRSMPPEEQCRNPSASLPATCPPALSICVWQASHAVPCDVSGLCFLPQGLCLCLLVLSTSTPPAHPHIKVTSQTPATLPWRVLEALGLGSRLP